MSLLQKVLNLSDFGKDNSDRFENKTKSASATTAPAVAAKPAVASVAVLNQTLKQHFGYSTLKPFQETIVSAALQGRDAFVMMATGNGKSLCYQLPPLVSGRICIVVSPLISLMQNQVQALREVNIKACFLGGGESAAQQAQAEREALSGRCSLIYLTAEKLPHWTQQLINLHKTHGIGLIAVDEAHCVSEWGHDFRPDYRKIHMLRNVLPTVGVMCLTATATPDVHKDIIANMRLRNPVEVKGSFDRPNLSYTVLRKKGRAIDMASVFGAKAAKKSKKSKDVVAAPTTKEEQKATNNPDGKKRRRNPNPEGMTIVYCNTKAETEGVAACLRKMGIKALAYHAGLAAKLRTSIHDDFYYDRVTVLVATTAFGMGIDKPDVRRIVHYGFPKNVETYYQQSGRAGRDGDPAECIVFWNDHDFQTNAKLIELSAGGRRSANNDDDKPMSEQQSATLKFNLGLLAKMKEYALLTTCRRKYILEYFGETVTRMRCGNCDNCSRSPAAQARVQQQQNQDCAADAALILSVIELTRGRYGLGLPVDVLMGSRRKQILEHQFEQLSCHGTGKHRNAEWWKCFGRLLVEKGLLREESRNSFGSSCTLSEEGQDFLTAYRIDPSRRPLVLQLPVTLLDLDSDKKTGSSRKKSTSTTTSNKKRSAPGDGAGLPAEWTTADRNLYNVLCDLRMRLARGKVPAVAPFMIFHNRHLQDMVSRRPLTRAEFLACEGVGVSKADEYGIEFLATIKEYCAKNKVKSADKPEEGSSAKKLRLTMHGE